jgi:hypothetical protein
VQPDCTTRTFRRIYHPSLKYAQSLPESREKYCSAIERLLVPSKYLPVVRFIRCRYFDASSFGFQATVEKNFTRRLARSGQDPIRTFSTFFCQLDQYCEWGGGLAQFVFGKLRLADAQGGRKFFLGSPSPQLSYPPTDRTQVYLTVRSTWSPSKFLLDYIHFASILFTSTNGPWPWLPWTPTL